MKHSLTFLLLPLLAACVSGTTDPREPAAMTLGDGRPAVLLVEDGDSWPHDAYQFGDASLEGDTLIVRITHGGGCNTHEYALLVSPVFLESYPVQMHGSLAHDAHGDPCRALLHPVLRFDLTPVKRAYRDAYRTSTGAISLRIRGFDQAVEYRF